MCYRRMYPSKNMHFIVHLYCYNAPRDILVAVQGKLGNLGYNATLHESYAEDCHTLGLCVLYRLPRDLCWDLLNADWLWKRISNYPMFQITLLYPTVTQETLHKGDTCANVCLYVLSYNSLPAEGFNVGRDGTLCSFAVWCISTLPVIASISCHSLKLGLMIVNGPYIR